MAHTQYWSERDSFFRRQERVFRNELLHEEFHNHTFSVFRMKDGKYAVTDYKQDPKDGNDLVYPAERDMILKMIEDPDLWKMFALRTVNEGAAIKLDTAGCGKLRDRHPDGTEPGTDELEFRDALKQAQDTEDRILEQEKIVGTPEWRRSVEREVHEMAEQDRARLSTKPAIARLFAEPSVRKRLKDEKAYVYKEQNRRIYEEQDARRVVEDGNISRNTLIAGAVAVAGILLFYLLVSLRRFSLQFIPAIICGTVSVILLVRDQNYDKKNMNARLPVWIVTIICVILGLTALVSMFS